MGEEVRTGGWDGEPVIWRGSEPADGYSSPAADAASGAAMCEPDAVDEEADMDDSTGFVPEGYADGWDAAVAEVGSDPELQAAVQQAVAAKVAAMGAGGDGETGRGDATGGRGEGTVLPGRPVPPSPQVPPSPSSPSPYAVKALQRAQARRVAEAQWAAMKQARFEAAQAASDGTPDYGRAIGDLGTMLRGGLRPDSWV